MATDNNNKVLNVPNLRFPEFSGEWERDSLMNIASISKGSGISKEQLLIQVCHAYYMASCIQNINQK